MDKSKEKKEKLIYQGEEYYVEHHVVGIMIISKDGDDVGKFSVNPHEVQFVNS